VYAALEKLEVVPPVVGVWAGYACPADGKLDAPEKLPAVAVDGIGV
jgi:hypothetical protein